MVISHSYVNVYQRVVNLRSPFEIAALQYHNNPKTACPGTTFSSRHGPATHIDLRQIPCARQLVADARGVVVGAIGWHMVQEVAIDVLGAVVNGHPTGRPKNRGAWTVHF